MTYEKHSEAELLSLRQDLQRQWEAYGRRPSPRSAEETEAYRRGNIAADSLLNMLGEINRELHRRREARS